MGFNKLQVIINGVRYVPESGSKPLSAIAIKRALLLKFWGATSQASESELDKMWEGVRIIASDNLFDDGWDESSTFTIQELLSAINELAEDRFQACKEPSDSEAIAQ